MRADPGTNLRRKQKTAAARPVTAKRRKRSPRPYPKANTSSFWTEALIGAEILLLHATPGVLRPGRTARGWFRGHHHSRFSRHRSLPHRASRLAPADWIPALFLRHRHQCRVSKPAHPAPPEPDDRESIGGDRTQDSPDWSQPGGVIARSVAGDRPKDVASVITLAAPIRGTVANRAVLRAAEAVRLRILEEHGRGVLPDCYTGRCTCNFLDSLHRKVPDSMVETAIYTRQDGIVDWRYCLTMDPEKDVEVPGTHIGMAFNPAAYAVVAERLARAQSSE